MERITRPLTAEEKARHAQVREKVMEEFPPAKKEQPVSTGIAAALRQARKARGLTYEAVAHQAGLPNANTVKDVEYGRNTDLPAIEAVAKGVGTEAGTGAGMSWRARERNHRTLSWEMSPSVARWLTSDTHGSGRRLTAIPYVVSFQYERVQE